jgi:hypothetical protein
LTAQIKKGNHAFCELTVVQHASFNLVTATICQFSSGITLSTVYSNEDMYKGEVCWELGAETWANTLLEQDPWVPFLPSTLVTLLYPFLNRIAQILFYFTPGCWDFAEQKA